mmetsp:Transcript_66956/g.176618  ORF Transcript_66956/g.176618 Transcript_66956/m.176618 type:complete len:432 (-) Transcript_66956:187-1482(-)
MSSVLASLVNLTSVRHSPPRLAGPRLPWTRRQRIVAVCRLLLPLLYFGIGVPFYCSVEGWNVWKSLYFLMVTASTVGYGDLSPTTPGSQVFTVFWIFLGIIAVFAQFSALVVIFFKPLFQASRDWLEHRMPQHAIDINDDGHADFKVPLGPVHYFSKNLLMPAAVTVVIQLGCAAVFCALEDWGFGLALYHCLVTATSETALSHPPCRTPCHTPALTHRPLPYARAAVGYGDVAITTDGGRMWAFFHIAVSVSLVAAFISDVADLAAARVRALQRLNLVRARMDCDLMRSLDVDKQGSVSRYEFVIGMLVKVNALHGEDVLVFNKLFDRLDKDHSGELTTQDIEAARLEFEAERARVGLPVPKQASKSGRLSYRTPLPIQLPCPISSQAPAEVQQAEELSATMSEVFSGMNEDSGITAFEHAILGVEEKLS